MTTTIILIAVLISSIITLFILDTGVNYLMKKKVSVNDKIPLTVHIVKAIVFISSGILLNDLFNSFETLSTVLSSSFTGNDLLFKSFSYFSIFWVITLLAIAIINWLSFLMYMLVSKGENLFIEIAKNNLGAVILFCGLLLALTIAIKTGLTPILDQLIPYPTLPEYH